jgi:hypothetical protein
MWGTRRFAANIDLTEKRLLGFAHRFRHTARRAGWANTPNFQHAALDKSPCAPFFKERRMRFWNLLA